MRRKIDDFLKEWKENEDRLPLIVKGARQIGKTASIMQFANDNYKNVVAINFVLQQKFKSIFDDGYDVDSSAMIELDGQKISMKELIERCFKDDRLPLDIIRDGKPMKVEMVMKPSPSRDLLMAEYDKMPRYVVFGGLVFQPIQRNVLAAADISMLDVALDIRNYQEDGGCVDHEDMVIITKVLDDEVNARLSGSISNSIVEKINGVKVKGLTHAYELLYPENMPEYVVIELKNGERPLVFEGKAMETANKRISKTYNIPKNARLDSSIPGRQSGRNTTPAR